MSSPQPLPSSTPAAQPGILARLTWPLRMGLIRATEPWRRRGAYLMESVWIGLGIAPTREECDAMWAGHQPWAIVQGLPSMVVAVAAIVLTVLPSMRSEAEMTQRYSEAAAAAVASDDNAAAWVFYRRFLELGMTENSDRFGMALVADRLGHKHLARQLVSELAPVDERGYAPAHLWQARRLLQATAPDAAALVAAESHLRYTLGSQLESAEVHALLARVYLATARIAEAEPHLAVAAATLPEANLTRAKLSAAQGDLLAARSSARQALKQFAKSEYAGEAPVLLQRAEAAVLAGDYATAERHLLDGTAADAERISPALLLFYQQWSLALERDPAAKAEQKLSVAERAVNAISKYGAETAANHAELFRLNLLLGRSSEAEEHLRAASGLEPEYSLDVALLLAARGETARAQWHARRAQAVYEKQLLTSPGDAVLRLRTADAALLLGQHARAVQLLRETAIAQRDPRLSAALARALVALWDANVANSLRELKSDSRSESATKTAMQTKAQSNLDLLRQALAAEPWNAAVWQRLVLSSRGESPPAAEARALIRAALEKGEPPAAIGLIVGTEALARGSYDEAVTHLELAYRQQPAASEVVNNLAWALTQVNPPNPTRALALLDDAIRREPKHVLLRDTRARIYTRLDRWPEALRDLEACEPSLQGNSTFHLLISEAYTHAGNPAKAEEHKLLARESRGN